MKDYIMLIASLVATSTTLGVAFWNMNEPSVTLKRDLEILNSLKKENLAEEVTDAWTATCEASARKAFLSRSRLDYRGLLARLIFISLGATFTTMVFSDNWLLRIYGAIAGGVCLLAGFQGWKKDIALEKSIDKQRRDSNDKLYAAKEKLLKADKSGDEDTALPSSEPREAAGVQREDETLPVNSQSSS